MPVFDRGQLEAFAQHILDLCAKGKAFEDQYVELKSDMPSDTYKIVRQICGHANASRNEPILWLFGVDQEKGVVGVKPFEIHEFLDNMRSLCEGTCPSVVNSFVTWYENHLVYVFQFDTSAAPYSIKNPIFGQNKTSIEREIPWRAGDGTRTANREQILRMLSNKINLPQVDFISASYCINSAQSGVLTPSGKEKYASEAELSILVCPVDDRPLVFLTHAIRAWLIFGDKRDLIWGCSIIPGFSEGESSFYITCTDNEVIAAGPGILTLRWRSSSLPSNWQYVDEIVLVAVLRIAGSNLQLSIAVTLDCQYHLEEDGVSEGDWIHMSLTEPRIEFQASTYPNYVFPFPQVETRWKTKSGFGEI